MIATSFPGSLLYAKTLGTRLEMIVAKGDWREAYFQDSGYFSRLVKRKRVNSQAF